jgi:predicted TPR repeat methyltransferase
VQNLQQQTQLAYTSSVASYKHAATLRPTDSNAWFQLGQTAQTSGDVTTALNAYKRYLKLSPNSTFATQIRQLIKALSPKKSG